MYPPQASGFGAGHLPLSLLIAKTSSSHEHEHKHKLIFGRTAYVATSAPGRFRIAANPQIRSEEKFAELNNEREINGGRCNRRNPKDRGACAPD